MITKIADLPAHVAGYEVTGQVTKEDYDTVIIPEIEKLARDQHELYFLFVLNTDITHISAGFWWDDLKVSLRHLRQWRKIAVVSDSKIIGKLTGIFNYVSPAKAKGFNMDELEEAKQWVAQRV